MAKKSANLFPPIKTVSGGYTAIFRFSDEARGERFFDSEWSIYSYSEPGSFTIGYLVDYRGYVNHSPSAASALSIGKAIKPGTRLSVTVKRHKRTGHPVYSYATIEVTSVEIIETATRITYTLL